MIYNNVWSSITVFTNDLITDLRIAYPDVPIQYFDWDAHATAHEMPNADLVGPLAIGITQESVDMYSVNFSIGVSTYATDKNLFRQRDYVSKIFDLMGAGNKLAYYNASLASHVSELVMTDGTILAPMTKAEIRPWQFVQGEALLVPVGVM